jgi:hypothetical protein
MKLQWLAADLDVRWAQVLDSRPGSLDENLLSVREAARFDRFVAGCREGRLDEWARPSKLPLSPSY